MGLQIFIFFLLRALLLKETSPYSYLSRNKFWGSLISLLFISWCMLYMCVVPTCRRWVPMCVRMWKLEVDSEPLLSFSTLAFKAGSLTGPMGPRAHHVGWTGQSVSPWGPPVSAPSAWVIALHYHSQFLSQFWGFERRSSGLRGKHLTHWSIFPMPWFYLDCTSNPSDLRA